MGIYRKSSVFLFEVMDYDISDVCHWQNTGIINIEGGPNKMTLAEAKEAYTKGLPIR